MTKTPPCIIAASLYFDLQNLNISQSVNNKHCATSRKVAGSIPDGVIGVFH
jgi:hypothetical protein